ncbi:MAG: DNA repair protein RecO [Peptococcaceae bacterium]|jgi:DNA repair protein RecO (recombination protein O)|nr:DNA repair protein RecO [Peptococcaceae bacterium]
MVSYKTEAIVLRLREYREADSLVTLLTRARGKVTAVAKGVYKPASKLRGGAQPYSVNAMMLDQGRSSLHILQQSECLEMMLPLRQSYEGMTLGAYWAELLENFAQEEMAEDSLYFLAKAGFFGLSARADKLMCRALEIRLIQQQGLSPDFHACCRCGRKGTTGGFPAFSAGAGGFLCGDCGGAAADGIRVGAAAAGLWQGLENLALDKLDRLRAGPEQLDELGRLLRRWISQQAGKPMRTCPLLKKMEV